MRCVLFWYNMCDVKMKYHAVLCVQKLLRIPNTYIHGTNNNNNSNKKITVHFVSGWNTRLKLRFVFDFVPGLYVYFPVALQT